MAALDIRLLLADDGSVQVPTRIGCSSRTSFSSRRELPRSELARLVQIDYARAMC